MKKIVFIAGSSSSGGLIKYIDGILRYSPPYFDVTLFCGDELPIGESSSVKIIRTDLVNESGLILLINKKYNRELLLRVKEINPDIVVFLNGYIRRGIGNYKCISVLHNQLLINTKLLFKQRPFRLVCSLFAVRRALLYSFKKADGIIFLSNSSKNETDNRNYKYNDGRVIFLGQENIIKAVKNTNDNVMIYVSTGFDYKNHKRLIEALAKVKEKDIDFRLVLVGCSETDRIKRLIKKNNLTDRIEFTGWLSHSEVDDLIDNSNFYVHPSLIESTSNGVLEGVRKGMTVICSDLDVFKEALGKHAYYFNPLDIDDIAKSIYCGLTNPRPLSEADCKEVLLPYDLKKAVLGIYEYAEFICNQEKKY